MRSVSLANLAVRTMPPSSNPRIALVCSLLLPGLGQIYDRESKKGVVIFACAVTLGVLGSWFSGFNRVATLLALFLLWGSAATDAYHMAKNAGQPAEFYYRKTFVVAMLLLVGPLALPLLWQSKNFSRTARWLWTILVISVALLFLATPYLLKGVVV
jgi:hypothetical protein